MTALDVSARTVVQTAREWIGTPVHHQEAQRGIGCDCVGLVRGVGMELGIFPQDFWTLPGVMRWRAYGREPVGTFLEAMAAFLTRREVAAEEALPGDVLALRFTGRPRHCAIVGDHPFGGLTLIHALHEKVIEHRLDSRWLKRAVAVYRFPGVES